MMGRTPTIKAVFLALMLLAVTSSAAYAACPSDMVSYWNFDDAQRDDTFSSTSVDSNRWNVYQNNGVATFTGSLLHLSGTAYSGDITAGVYSDGKWTLAGDFDIQVDYTNLAPPSSAISGGPMFYVRSPGANDVFYVRRQPITGRYDSDAKINGAYTSYVYVATSDTSGRFRITRNGTMMSAYYWSGGNWVFLRNATNSEFAQPLSVWFESYYNTPTGAFSVDYDNFTVNKGEIVVDSKAGNNGTIDGAVWTTGKVGNALRFDGINDNIYLGSVPQTNFERTNPFTISAWIKTSDTSEESIIARRLNTPPSSGWMVSKENQVATFKLMSTAWTDGFELQGNTDIVDDTWHHIVFVYDGSSNKNGVTLYVDGVNDGTLTKTSGTDTISGSTMSTGFLDIGMLNKTSVPFTGLIDEVAVYDSALSPADVAALYYASRNLSQSYCRVTPDLSGFDEDSTNLSTVADLMNVSGLVLAKSGQGNIQWTAPTNVAGMELSNQVRIGTGFVSINKSSLHSSLDGPANVSINVGGCDYYNIYYATGFLNSLSAIKSAGQACDAESSPACTNIKCENNILSFTVSHFDGYGGEGGSFDQNVPEFGTIALLAALGLVAGGIVSLRKR